MNRTIQPEIKEISSVEIQKVEQKTLGNNIQLTTLNAGSQELLRVEFIFKAGSRYQSQPLVAGLTNDMLLEGTSKMTGREINEKVDFYGGFMNVEITKDYAILQVFVLAKYLNNVLEVIADCIYDSQYPSKQFDVLKANKRSKYLVNAEKVDFLCRQKFSELIFNGGDYGTTANLDSYDSISLDQLKAFYSEHYLKGSIEVLVSGAISDKSMNTLENFLSNLPKNESNSLPELKKGSFEPGKVLVEKENAIQSAIRMGRPMFTINGEDYMKFKVLNTVLGGYFGSRLMSNIREDKGYTYGIGSALISYQDQGVFLLASEVGADVCNDALKEIYFELGRLRDELIPEKELDLVRNYMLGNIVRNLNGAFDMMERYKEIKHCDLSYDYFPKYMETIKMVTSKDLQEVANRYLKEEDLLELVVGKKG